MKLASKKRIISIIFINLLSLILIIICTDWFLTLKEISNSITQPNINFELTPTERLEQNLPFDKSKRPIVIIGCSFAWGTNLSIEDTFAYKLQKLTGRKVYNYAKPGHGVQHLLLKSQKSRFLKEVKPEYVIYVFMEDHTRRMYKTYRLYRDTRKYIKYKFDKNNKENPLYIDTNESRLTDIINVTQIAKRLNDFSIFLKNNDKKFDFLKMHILQSNKNLKRTDDNINLVVLVYNSASFTKSEKESIQKPFHTSRWNELQDNGIEVINFDTPNYDYFKDDKYNTKEFDADLEGNNPLGNHRHISPHPSGLAWDIIVPIVAKKLNLLN